MEDSLLKKNINSGLNSSPKGDKTRSFPQRFACKNIIILSIFFLVAGFTLGQYFETKDRNSVFVLNEGRLLKLVSIGLALESKERGKEGLTEKDKRVIRDTTKDLSIYLNQYLKRPILIQLKNNRGYELYRGVKKIDITKELIIKLIGKEKWAAIGKEFSASS